MTLRSLAPDGRIVLHPHEPSRYPGGHHVLTSCCSCGRPLRAEIHDLEHGHPIDVLGRRVFAERPKADRSA